MATSFRKRGTRGPRRTRIGRARRNARLEVPRFGNHRSRTNGFYVEDDGPDILEADREAVFEAGYSEFEDGMGLGLTFVAHLADAYSWSYRLTASDDGGVRFEFTDVDCSLET